MTKPLCLFVAALWWALPLCSAQAQEGGENVQGQLDVGPTKVVLGEKEALLEARVLNGKASQFQYVWTQTDGASSAKIEAPDKLRTKVSDLVPGTYVFSVASSKDGQQIDTKSFTLEVRAPQPGKLVPWNDPRIRIVGRYAAKSDRADLGWPGITIRARFTGTSLRARMKAGWGGQPKFLVIVDGKVDGAQVVATDMRKEILLAEGLTAGEHELELVRLDGGWSGAAEFGGLVLEPEAQLLDPPAPLQRRMEFYGDSITEGSYMSEYSHNNPYRAYAMTTARMLGADPHLVAKGGIGMVRGYALPQTLPGIFDRSIPMGGKDLWDFSKWTPHVVVINAFQNDKWTLGSTPVEDCIEAYRAFLVTLRSKYPKALLVATLGSMDAVSANSEWPAHLQAAVDKYREESGDKNVDILIFEYQNHRGHPDTADAAAMAKALSEFINSKGDAVWKD